MRTLTAAAIERLKPPATGQKDHFDKGYPGFALRISHAGARSFVHVFRLHGKLYRRTLGRWPSTSLTTAREVWRRDREAIARGENPARRDGEGASPDSFGAVAADWLKRDQGENRSREAVARIIARAATPILGDRLISTISRRDVVNVVDKVVDRGHPIAARRLHAHLHRLFRWAVGRGIIDLNPMAELPKPGAEAARDRVLDERELATIWKAAASMGYPFGSIVQLLLLTAARRDEIGSLRWSSEVVAHTIRLAGERTKTGTARTIPLSSAAMDIIRALPRIGEFVFTTTGATAVSGWSKAKKTIDRAAGELNGAPLAEWRLHDLRRTAATGMQRLGVRLEVVETILGHVSGSRAGVVGVYQRHQFEDEARAALEVWAAEITRIVGQPAPDRAVLPLRGRHAGR
jgi:integrase